MLHAFSKLKFNSNLNESLFEANLAEMITHHSPFALPAVLGHVLQRRVQAVGVIADVTVITQKQTARIGGLATGLANRALQTTPAFTQYHLGDLSK